MHVSYHLKLTVLLISYPDVYDFQSYPSFLSDLKLLEAHYEQRLKL